MWKFAEKNHENVFQSPSLRSATSSPSISSLLQITCLFVCLNVLRRWLYLNRELKEVGLKRNVLRCAKHEDGAKRNCKKWRKESEMKAHIFQFVQSSQEGKVWWEIGKREKLIWESFSHALMLLAVVVWGFKIIINIVNSRRLCCQMAAEHKLLLSTLVLRHFR